jgi:hypothetical protein
MDFDSIRPILSGIAGGAVAVWLGRAWAHRMPTQRGAKSAAMLLRENGVPIRAANCAAAGILLASLLLYQTGVFARNDWRGLGLGLGGAFTAPLVLLAVWSLCTGRRASEVFAAYALSQKTPPAILFILQALGAIALVYTAYRIML